MNAEYFSSTSQEDQGAFLRTWKGSLLNGFPLYLKISMHLTISFNMRRGI